MKGLRQDVQRKISRLRGLAGAGNNNGPSGFRGSDRCDQGIPLEPLPAASSMESLPSGSGSSKSYHHIAHSSLPINLDHLCSYSIFSTCAGTQALVREGSNESSLSPMTGYDATFIIGRARALVDYTPSPYDKDALKFKVRGFFQGSCSGEGLHVTLLYGYALFCGLD